jgi:predicted AAA+ superfamily ATPase
MERTSMTFLANWLNSSRRLPLVIRGARQVGKTWLARHFAESQGLQLIEINFEDKKELVSAFSSNDPTIILQNLEDALGFEKLIPQKCLLFLDEIQAVPSLYPKLRWFAEKMPQLPVIAAGSLLEFIFKKTQRPMSMPVGRVEFMYLEPLSFEEFLLALKKHQLARLINRFTWAEEIPSFTHQELMNYFKQYIIIGGMPAAVATWIETQSIREVSRVHQNILESFRGDFHKYAGRFDPDLIEKTLKQVPIEVGQKFMYSKVTKEAQAASIKNALDLLCQARICHRVLSCHANGVPLDAEINERFFKVIFLDVGLCSASLKLALQDLRDIEELDLINAGGIAEQVVGQLLRTIEPAFFDPELYYWLRHEKNSDAEIDYVIQYHSNVIPVEVKAGKTGTLKSLHVFMSSKKRKLAVRVNSALPLKSTVEVKTSQDELVSYELRSIPFYLLGELHRLVE